MAAFCESSTIHHETGESSFRKTNSRAEVTPRVQDDFDRILECIRIQCTWSLCFPSRQARVAPRIQQTIQEIQASLQELREGSVRVKRNPRPWNYVIDKNIWRLDDIVARTSIRTSSLSGDPCTPQFNPFDAEDCFDTADTIQASWSRTLTLPSSPSASAHSTLVARYTPAITDPDCDIGHVTEHSIVGGSALSHIPRACISNHLGAENCIDPDKIFVIDAGGGDSVSVTPTYPDIISPKPVRPILVSSLE